VAYSYFWTNLYTFITDITDVLTFLFMSHFNVI